MPRRSAVAALLASAALSCSPAPAPAPEAPFKVVLPPPTPVSPESSAAAGAAGEATPRPEGVKPPTEIACKLHAIAFPDRPIALAVAPGKPAYADLKVGVGEADLIVGVAERAPPIFVATRTSAVALDGYANGATLRPARPFLATPSLAPRGEAALTVVGAKDGKLALELALPSTVSIPQGAKLSFERPCEDVAAGRVDAAYGEAPFAEKKAKKKARPRGATVTLLDRAGGSKVATVTVDSSQIVDVFDERAGHALARITLPELVVQGWAKASELAPFEAAGVSATATSGGLRPDKNKRGNRIVRCTKEVPLVARRGDDRVTVGRVLASQRLHLLPELREGFRAASVEASGMFPSDGVELEVALADVAGCTPD